MCEDHSRKKKMKRVHQLGDEKTEHIKQTKEQIVKEMLFNIGEDPNREGLIGTPDRVVRMWKEIYRGYDPAQKPKMAIFKNGTDGVAYDQMVTDTGTFHSQCEHHMVPFFGTYWFGYIPDKEGNIIGLSKVARVVDYYSAKLQIQERLVQEIVECLWEELSKGAVRPLGMGLVMEGEHLCKTMRGAKKQGKMTTTKLKGAFYDNAIVRQEFLEHCKK